MKILAKSLHCAQFLPKNSCQNRYPDPEILSTKGLPIGLAESQVADNQYKLVFTFFAIGYSGVSGGIMALFIGVGVNKPTLIGE